MGATPLENLQRQLEAGRHHPVYLLHGEETFLKSEALTALKNYVFERTSRDFNYDRYDLREGQLEQGLASARTFPMMGPMRLVVLHGADVVLGSARGKGGAAAQKKQPSKRKKDRGRLADQLLEDYLADPEPRTVLVFVADKPDARRKNVRQIGKIGAVLALTPLRDREVPDWVVRRAQGLGLRLEGATAGLLSDVLGADLGSIERSLEKLALYVGENGTVRPEDVEACVARTKVHSIFELMDAVGRRQTRTALTLLSRMLGPRDAPLRIQSMLFRQVRRVWTVRSLLEDGCPRGELPARVGLPPFLLADLTRQAGLFSRADLLQAVDSLFAADRALKTSQGQPERVMEALVLGLCGAGERRRGYRPQTV